MEDIENVEYGDIDNNIPVHNDETLVNDEEPSIRTRSLNLSTGARSSSQRVRSPSTVQSVDMKSLKNNNYIQSPKHGSSAHSPSAAASAVDSTKQTLDDQIEKLTLSVERCSKDMESLPLPLHDPNVDKIANMSKFLTQEANALRQSIKTLSEDIVKTKLELLAGYGNKVCPYPENVNFPYHLFLIEIIVNKIHMKCECFDLDLNNLVITASFLGKPPIVLYDPTYCKIDNICKLNVGKSTLFAMTYDTICKICDFEIVVELTKQPPCSPCVTKIAKTHMDYTKEFFMLRDELCKKWAEEKPNDDILCTTSTPLSKNLYYLSQFDCDSTDSIGVIEISLRMSFLGKEITTTFCGTSKQTSRLTKEDNGMAMYSCQKVEMDDQDRILLDEGVFDKKPVTRQVPCNARNHSPMSEMSIDSTNKRQEAQCYVNYKNNAFHDGMGRYDEILTKVNSNELKIRVPKSNKVDRTGKYDKIQELCCCEDTPYNTGDQIQFEMPRDMCDSDKSQNLKYSYNGCIKQSDPKRKIISVTPTNCPIPVEMEKRPNTNNDIFILKIGKKLETKDKKTDLEIELVTPKLPQKATEAISQQCSNDKIHKLIGKVGKKSKKAAKKKPKGDSGKKKKEKK